MPTQQLIEAPFFVTCLMLALMFCGALLPMLFLPRFIPELITSAHKKNCWLDGLRGLAALTVALNHAPLVNVNLQLVPQVFFFSTHDSSLFFFLGSIGVQLFFCITGLLFANKILHTEQVDWTMFFRNRIYRIVPAYFFSCVLAIMIAARYSWPINQNYKEIIASIPSLFSFGLIALPKINDFDFMRLLGVNWTLAMEWKFYLMLPVIFVLIREARRITMFSILLLTISDVVYTNQGFWVYFVSGAICAPFFDRQLSSRICNLSYILITLTLVIFSCCWDKIPNYGYLRWILMSVFFASISIARPRILSMHAFVAMGTISYSFYLLHAMTLFLLIKIYQIYVEDISNLSMLFFALLICSALALTTIFSTLSYFFIERPFMVSRRNNLAQIEEKIELQPQPI